MACAQAHGQPVACQAGSVCPMASPRGGTVVRCAGLFGHCRMVGDRGSGDRFWQQMRARNVAQPPRSSAHSAAPIGQWDVAAGRALAATPRAAPPGRRVERGGTPTNWARCSIGARGSGQRMGVAVDGAREQAAHPSYHSARTLYGACFCVYAPRYGVVPIVGGGAHALLAAGRMAPEAGRASHRGMQRWYRGTWSEDEFTPVDACRSFLGRSLVGRRATIHLARGMERGPWADRLPCGGTPPIQLSFRTVGSDRILHYCGDRRRPRKSRATPFGPRPRRPCPACTLLRSLLCCKRLWSACKRSGAIRTPRRR